MTAFLYTGGRPFNFAGLPLRGSSFNNTSNGGVSAVNLNNERSNVSTNVGFRSA